MKRRIRFEIRDEYIDLLLLDFLVRRFPYHERDAWRAVIESGRVTVAGVRGAVDQRLRLGDVVEYIAHDIPEPRVSLNVKVVYDDADIIVVNKPGNLPTHPGGRYFNHTLWAMLVRDYGLQSPSMVNRLDRETSGLVVVAKTPAAAKRARAQFARHEVQKTYRALVEGCLSGIVSARGWLVADASSPVHKRRRFVAEAGTEQEPPPEEGAEWAETSFRGLGCWSGVSEVEVLPRTGRLHQIRATLQCLGFPIVGDKLYGADPGIFLRFCTDALTDADRSALRMDRQALHAARLRFRHPRSGAWVQYDAPLPDDMSRLLRELRGESSPAASR